MGKIKQERAGIDDPQDAVDIEWPCLGFNGEPLAGNDLEDIAGLDVLLTMPHNRFISRSGEIRPRLERDRRFRVDVAQPKVRAGRSQAIDQFVNAVARSFIGGLGVGSWPDVRLRHHEDRLADMIENHHPIIKRKRKIRQAAIIRRRVRQILGVAHRIVRSVAHRPTREARQATQLHRAITLDKLAQARGTDRSM